MTTGDKNIVEDEDVVDEVIDETEEYIEPTPSHSLEAIDETLDLDGDGDT
jgi:hypothetical protein